MQTDLATQTEIHSSITPALEAIGCKIEEIVAGTGILFSYGGAYYVVSASEDLTYLCVYCPRFGDLSDFPTRLAADESIHELNARAKLARVWIDGGQLHASAETLLNPNMTLTVVFQRLLKTLQHIVFETRLFQRLASAQEVKSKADNLPATTASQPIALH